MGLDMYLTAERYISPYGTDNNESALRKAIAVAIGLPETGDEIDHGVGRITGVSARAAYWRKSNHIHKWFVDNAQDGEDDCRKYSVYREQLDELRTLCETVLARRNEPDAKAIAEEHLPVEEGFFFGGTDYEDWYYEDLENTIEMLSPENLDRFAGFDFEYQSSW